MSNRVLINGIVLRLRRPHDSQHNANAGPSERGEILPAYSSSEMKSHLIWFRASRSQVEDPNSRELQN